jgi:hypothetical protein
MITTLFSEASSNVGALLLDDGSFVGDGLGCSNIADELLDYAMTPVLVISIVVQPKDVR